MRHAAIVSRGLVGVLVLTAVLVMAAESRPGALGDGFGQRADILDAEHECFSVRAWSLDEWDSVCPCWFVQQFHVC